MFPASTVHNKMNTQNLYTDTWTIAALSTERLGPGFRAAAFCSKGRNALWCAGSDKNLTISHLAKNWGAMQLVM